MATEGIKKILERQDFTFSNTSSSSEFLPKSKGDSVEIKPLVLGTQESIRGVSFFAALKALDMEKAKAPWYVDHLRLPGTRTGVNPDTQKIVLALLHGLHAYFASNDKAAPSLRDPLPTRFRYVVDTFNKLKDQSVKTSVDRVFTVMKRQYLNTNEQDDELQILGLMDALKTPVKFLNNQFFNIKTGTVPISITERDVPDTQTVRDFYVRKIPLMSEILGH
jgi:hypothetical protein